MTRHKRELLPHEIGSVAVNVALQPHALCHQLLPSFLLLLLVLPAVFPACLAHAHAAHTPVSGNIHIHVEASAVPVDCPLFANAELSVSRLELHTKRI